MEERRKEDSPATATPVAESAAAMLRALREARQRIRTAAEPKDVYEVACEAVLRLRCAEGVWLGRLDETGGISTVVQRGVSEATIDQATFPADHLPWCVRRALTESETVAVLEPNERCENCPLRSHFPEHIRVVARLRAGQKDHGVMALYAATGRLNESACTEAFADLAEDAGYALHLLETQAEERRAAEALRESEAQIRTLLESNIIGIIFAGLDGSIVGANQAFLDIVGYDRDDLEAGRLRWDELSPREYVERDQQAVAELRTTGISTPYEKEYVCKDGSRVPILIGGARLVGQTEQTLAFVLDLRERKELEGQLRQAQKMEAIGRLAGGVAHDFNNLLSVIIGHGELAAAELGNEHPVVDDIEQALAAAHRASALTSQLLAFSRRQALRPEVFEIDEAVRRLTGMLHRLIDENVRLSVDLRAHGARVEADTSQLDLVLMNLAVNARDAMPGGGKLTIATSTLELTAPREMADSKATPGRYAVLRVSDTGHGMDAETKARIFEPFFTTKEHGKGTGLGLASVYGIVQQSGGFIDVETAPDEGTTFFLLLPLRDEQPSRGAVSQDRAPVEAAEKARKILVLEDDDAVRRLVEKSLVRQGFDVLAAPTGARASELAEAHGEEIDLFLTDLTVPDGSGLDVAASITARRPSIRVVYMSGYVTDMPAERLPSGAVPVFLPKPFTPSALVAVIQETLDAPFVV